MDPEAKSMAAPEGKGREHSSTWRWRAQQQLLWLEPNLAVSSDNDRSTTEMEIEALLEVETGEKGKT